MSKMQMFIEVNKLLFFLKNLQAKNCVRKKKTEQSGIEKLIKMHFMTENGKKNIYMYKKETTAIT